MKIVDCTLDKSKKEPEIISINVSDDSLISEVKNLIKIKTKISINGRLIHSGRILNDTKTVHSYNIDGWDAIILLKNTKKFN